MEPVFADTVYFLALLNPRDQWHGRAEELRLQIRAPLLTSEFILTEVADGLSNRNYRPLVAQFFGLMRQQPDVKIVPVSSILFRNAFDLFSARPDKEWSLTDCSSFTIMQQNSVTKALTSDHHFSQAGFEILM